MVTNKKSALRFACHLGLLVFAFVLTGCQPAGPKALLLGEKFIKQGEYDKAIKYLSRATVLIPEHPQVWNHLGLAYHGLQQPVKAVDAYQRAIRIDRNLAAPHYNLGVLLLEQQHLPQAIAELHAFVNLQTNSGPGWVKLGTAYLRLKRPDDAERALTQALRLDPKNAEAYNALGLAHVQRKRPREGMQAFDNALQVNPTYAPAVLNQAVVSHQFFANKELAVERYKAFLGTKPDPAVATRVQQALRSIEAEIAGVGEMGEKPDAVTNQFSNFLETNLATRTPSATNQPPAVAATNVASRPPASAKTNVVAATGTNAPVAVQSQPKTNAPPIVAQAAPKTNAPPVRSATTNVTTVAAATNKPPVVEKTPEPEPEPPLKVEVLQVEKEPEFKPPSDLPPKPPVQMAAVATTNKSDMPETQPLLIPRRERKEEGKQGFLQRVNPVRWFRDGDRTEPAEVVRTPPPRPTYPPVVRNTAPSPDPEPQRLILRYQYRKKVPLKVGNRAEAAKYFQKGAEAHRLRSYAEAITQYRTATNLDPTYFEAYYNLGLAAYQHKNLPLALTANELAVVAKPDSSDARFNFALTLREGNYPGDAANELKTLIEAEPDSERAHFALANIYAQQLDQPALARKHYLAVLELNPVHPEAPLIRQWLANHQ